MTKEEDQIKSKLKTKGRQRKRWRRDQFNEEYSFKRDMKE
jgi:hypothetical protein